MTVKTKLIAVGSISAVAVASLFGVIGITTISARLASGEVPLIVQNLASKFNTSEADVQKVFEDTREQQKVARLDNAIKEGDITASQKDIILKKQQEVEAKIEAIDNQSLTATARQEAMRAVMDEVKEWADSNDVPPGLVMGGKMMSGGRGGFGDMEGGMGMH